VKNLFPILFCLAIVAGALRAQEQKLPADGITEPVFDVTLSFPDPGIIVAENFKEGDFVNTNDVLVQLDSRLEELEVARRRLVMENHKSEFEATQKVFEKSAVSYSREELLKKKADFEVAQVEYEIAVEQLRRRSLRPPRAGVITELKLHTGEACIAYQPVVRVVDTRQCYFVSNLEGAQGAGFKSGQAVQLQIDGVKTNSIVGKVVFVSPVVDPASGLQKLRIVFDNTDGQVRPGGAGRLLLQQR
jgi:RND family efflux transporter MFP subunit